MPIQNFEKKDGKYGPIYKINKTDRIRTDYRGKIVLEVTMPDGSQKSKTYTGVHALTDAASAADEIKNLRFELEKSQSETAYECLGIPFPLFARKSIGEYPGIEESTRKRYEQILEGHILKSALFTTDLRKISRKQIKSYLRQLRKDTSEGIAEITHVVLCKVFDEAIEDDIIDANPARGLHKSVFKERKRKNRKTKYKANPLSVRERDHFLKTGETICCQAKLMVLRVMVFGGLRLGEALALRVRHLNFCNLTILIEKSFRTGKFGKPKYNSVRTVHLPKFLMDEFKTFIKQNGFKLDDLLFQDPNLKKKQPFSQRKIQYIVGVICKAAGIKIIHPHDLRHTYATTMLMAHQSIQFVQEQLGHVSIQTTKDIYGKWIEGEGRYRIEEALMGIPTGAVPAQISGFVNDNDHSDDAAYRSMTNVPSSADGTDLGHHPSADINGAQIHTQ